MKKTTKRGFSVSVGTAVLIVLACLLGGCATVTPPDFLAQGFTPTKMGSLYVLPVVDHRVDQTRELKLDDWVIPTVEHYLYKRNYSYKLETDRSLVKMVSRDSIETLKPEWIADLRICRKHIRSNACA